MESIIGRRKSDRMNYYLEVYKSKSGDNSGELLFTGIITIFAYIIYNLLIINEDAEHHKNMCDSVTNCLSQIEKCRDKITSVQDALFYLLEEKIRLRADVVKEYTEKVNINAEHINTYQNVLSDTHPFMERCTHEFNTYKEAVVDLEDEIRNIEALIQNMD
jgi:hypothetical protein